jgi:cytochrome c553
MKMTELRIPLAALAAMVFLICSSYAKAAHTGGDVALKDANGNVITNGTTPYSPKATCGACHNYGSGESHSTHVQGVLDAANNLYWQADDVKSFANGVSTSYHMNQGRNENYSNVSRTTYNDPFFTNSPGMFGKY